MSRLLKGLLYIADTIVDPEVNSNSVSIHYMCQDCWHEWPAKYSWV